MRKRRAIGFTIVILCALIPAFWHPSWIGRALIVNGRLEQADAIVVLGGNLPFRSAEAARLFRGGWAPRVWITAPETASELEAVKLLGLASVPDDQLSIRVLEKFGVPATSIKVLNPHARDTVEELRLITKALRETGLKRVIIVTSPTHTRRVRAIWRIVARRGQLAFVHSIDREMFDPDHWWTTERDRGRVRRELSGLAYVWFGLPVAELMRRIFH